MQMIESSEPRGEKVRLARMPHPSSERPLQAKKQWYDVRLRSWAGAREGFDEALDLYIRTVNSRKLQEFDHENRILAREICNQRTSSSSLSSRTSTPLANNVHEDHSEHCRQDRSLALKVLPTALLQVKRGSGLGIETVEGGLGRATSGWVSTIAGHGRIKLEGHHWANASAQKHGGDCLPHGPW